MTPKTYFTPTNMRLDEVQVIHYCIHTLAEAGWTLRGVDYGAGIEPDTDTPLQCLEAVDAVETCHIHFRNPKPHTPGGSLLIVLGNEPGVVIADLSMNLDEALPGLEAYTDAVSDTYTWDEPTQTWVVRKNVLVYPAPV